MIRLFAKVNGTSYDVSLPNVVGWGINPDRSFVSRRTLNGETIHLVGPEKISSAQGEYDAIVSKETGDQVEALKTATSTCFLSDGKKSYEVVIRARIEDTALSSQKRLIATFNFVRRIA